MNAGPHAVAPSVVPLVDLGVVNGPLEEEFVAAFRSVFAESDFGHGPAVDRFESELAELVGVEHALGVNSGTAALELALRAAAIGPGDEVILPANSFFATGEAVANVGADVVLVDPDLDSAIASPETVRAHVGPRTAAIIGVHLYGQPVDADGYRAIARANGLLFLEDAAQALGANWNHASVGSLGGAAAFSFYPTKNLGALGQAGAITTNDATLARNVRLLRSHGEERRYVHERPGFNERLHGMQAAFLSVKLRHLPSAQRARSDAALAYGELLVDVPDCTRLAERGEAACAHHLMVVRVPRRDAVLAAMHRAGVMAAIHYPIPIHMQPAATGWAAPGSLPNAEQLAAEVLSLPFYPGIRADQVERSVDALRLAIKSATGSLAGAVQ